MENSKHEARNPCPLVPRSGRRAKQIQKVLNFENSNLNFVSSFEIRISDLAIHNGIG